MNPSESTSESRISGERLLLPQVVYDCKGARFYNKLESWWNRPSRLYQAAEDLIYEDLRRNIPQATAGEEDIWEWLEERARRTSILHQMLRRVEAPTEDHPHSVRQPSGFTNALSSKLAKEYLATLVKILLCLSPRAEGNTNFGAESPFKFEEEEDRVLEEILAVCAYQLFQNLRAARSEEIRRNDTPTQRPNCGGRGMTPQSQAQSLASDVESLLYALLDGFAEAKLGEINAGSDSESESFDEAVEEAFENLPPELKKSETRLLSHSQPDLKDYLGIGITTQANDSTPTPETFLFDLINLIDSDLADGSQPRSECRFRRAWMLLDTLEGLRIGLCSLYDTVAIPNTGGHADEVNGRSDSLYCVLTLDCQESVSWTAFNACLAKTTLALSIYGHQQRTKSGKSPMRNRPRDDERDSSRIISQSPGFDHKVGVVIGVTVADVDRTLSMIFIEKSYVELLDAAVTCADFTEWTPRIHDILRLLADLFDRFVEYQTSVWMELPSPKMKIADFLDATEVARTMRRLVVTVMLRHGMTTDQLASIGFERDLVWRWKA